MILAVDEVFTRFHRLPYPKYFPGCLIQNIWMGLLKVYWILAKIVFFISYLSNFAFCKVKFQNNLLFVWEAFV